MDARVRARLAGEDQRRSPRNDILSLCDITTVTVQPWVEAGHAAMCVDVQHDGSASQGLLLTSSEDVFHPTWDEYVSEQPLSFVAAFPPCTDLAVSGARWFREKGLRRRGEAIALVGRCLELAEASGAPYFIENPVSILSSHWRKPDYTFHPYEYGGYLGGENDGYTKKTCLWTGNGFVMPEPKPIPLADDHDRIHRAPPNEERANFRSATPRGFAQAVFEANHHG